MTQMEKMKMTPATIYRLIDELPSSDEEDFLGFEL